MKASRSLLFVGLAISVAASAVLYATYADSPQLQAALAPLGAAAAMAGSISRGYVQFLRSKVVQAPCGLFPVQNEYTIMSNRVVLPGGVRPAALRISWGKIVAITFDIERAANEFKRLHFGDAVISPGMIDAHVHFNEPGRTEWEGYATGTMAAAKGGITTAIDMPLNSMPSTITVEALQEKQELAMNAAVCNVGHWAGLTPANANDAATLCALWDAGALGFKAFMCDSGVEGFDKVEKSDLQSAVPVLKALGAPLFVHAELVSAVNAPQSEPEKYWTYLASRPSSFEHSAIKALIMLLENDDAPAEPGFRIHIAHLACAECLKEIKEAQERGLPISVETGPHYLLFAARSIADGQTQYKCAPPIRAEENRRKLVEAVLDGSINLVASDHSPSPPELKELESGNFLKAWGGISGLQYLMPATWTAIREMRATVNPDPEYKLNEDLQLLSRVLSSEPAKLAKLDDKKGKIAVGYDADLTIWYPERDADTTAASIEHRHKLTPYEGMKLKGRVIGTVVLGSAVQHVEEMERSVGCGVLVKRGPWGEEGK